MWVWRGSALPARRCDPVANPQGARARQAELLQGGGGGCRGPGASVEASDVLSDDAKAVCARVGCESEFRLVDELSCSTGQQIATVLEIHLLKLRLKISSTSRAMVEW